jgi:hypothetical protein
MSGERSRFREPAANPDMRLEIRLAEGVEAEGLRLEQAKLIMEVTQWVAQRRSGNGSANKAA